MSNNVRLEPLSIGFTPGAVPRIDSVDPGSLKNMSGLDANVYATKKTIAQGMLDVALLTANASQLKYLLQLGSKDQPFFYLMVTLISLSIILQILIGIVIMIKSRFSINNEAHHKRADFLNNLVVYLVFAVTVINVFMSAFGIDPGMAVQRALYERDYVLKNLTSLVHR